MSGEVGSGGVAQPGGAAAEGLGLGALIKSSAALLSLLPWPPPGACCPCVPAPAASSITWTETSRLNSNLMPPCALPMSVPLCTVYGACVFKWGELHVRQKVWHFTFPQTCSVSFPPPTLSLPHLPVSACPHTWLQHCAYAASCGNVALMSQEAPHLHPQPVFLHQ